MRERVFGDMETWEKGNILVCESFNPYVSMVLTPDTGADLEDGRDPQRRLAFSF
jgi:hypothetical protein